MVDLEAEERTVREVSEAWFAAELRRDEEACLAPLAPEFTVQTEGYRTITDLATMRSYWEDFFKVPYIDIVLEPRDVVVAASGDIAYDIGPWTVVFDEDGQRSEATGKSTIIWRKLGGQWKSVLLSFSMDAAPAATPD